MISKLYPLKAKLLEVTQQCNFWKLKKIHEDNPELKDCLATIITLMEDYKLKLRQEIDTIEEPS
jgi:hypothetical protein